jgi:hypothetical protein
LPEPSPWLSLAIALIALIAPGLPWAYRRWFKKGRVEVHPTGNIEVGYGNFGPSIALQGTLQGIDRDLFIRTISLRVTREADDARHEFEWAVFRSSRFVNTRPREIAWTLPSSFLLLTSQPFRYNIVFNDAAFRQQYVQPLLDNLRAEWVNRVQQVLGVLPKVLLTGRSLESLPPGSRPGSASRAPSGAPGCCSPRSSR